MHKQKKWWAPVWNGLVMDKDAAHYRRMRSAIWLYAYLLLNADRRTGFLARKLGTISKDMGINPGTLKRWMAILRRGGYVASRSNGRSLAIRVNKWRSIQGVRDTDRQENQMVDTRKSGFKTLGAALDRRFKANASPRMLGPPGPKER